MALAGDTVAEGGLELVSSGAAVAAEAVGVGVAVREGADFRRLPAPVWTGTGRVGCPHCRGA